MLMLRHVGVFWCVCAIFGPGAWSIGGAETPNTPPRVALERLLADRERWKSNRVEVSGYYVYGMELSGLFSSAADVRNIYPRITNALWINYWDSLPTARTNNIELLDNQYVRIVGTFDFRRLGCGHCNQWPAMITHIESIERIPDPPKTAPREAASRDSRIKKPLDQ